VSAVGGFDPPTTDIERVVDAALAEDLGREGDVTSRATIPETADGTARFVARAAGVLAGTAAATAALQRVDGDLAVTWGIADGDRVEPGEVLGEVTGRVRSILTAERTALNLLTHCSGVATATRSLVDAVAATGSPTRVRDTRKTLPGLRALEKAAVRAGGGVNHRMSLSDGVLIKDNHVGVAGVAGAVARVRDAAPGLPIEVECDDLDQVKEAVAAGADLVLLDNMDPAGVAAAVAAVGGAVPLEVSGGVTLDNVAAYAATGVQYIAVGAITHSAPALDIGLDLEA
jgi:nicotinate-nucleotide pyrophosphorylase (carboxylating)